MRPPEGARAPDPFRPQAIGYCLRTRGQRLDARNLDELAELLAKVHARGDTAARAEARTSLTRWRGLTAEEQQALTFKAAALVLGGLR